MESYTDDFGVRLVDTLIGGSMNLQLNNEMSEINKTSNEPRPSFFITASMII